MTEAKRKAEKAERLLTDPMFIEAMDAVKSDLYREITDSSHEQQSLREDCYYTLKAINRLESILKRYINRGKS